MKEFTKDVVEVTNVRRNEVVYQDDKITKIQLNLDKVVTIDTKDYLKVKDYRWHCYEYFGNWYVMSNRKTNGSPTRLHRLIMNAHHGDQVFHVNHNTLDCRSENLLVSNKQHQVIRQRNRILDKPVERRYVHTKAYILKNRSSNPYRNTVKSVMEQKVYTRIPSTLKPTVEHIMHDEELSKYVVQITCVDKETINKLSKKEWSNFYDRQYRSSMLAMYNSAHKDIHRISKK